MKYLRTGLLMTLVVSLVLPVSAVSANSSLDANTSLDDSSSTSSPVTPSLPAASSGSTELSSESSAGDTKPTKSSVGDQQTGVASTPKVETAKPQAESQPARSPGVQSSTEKSEQSTTVSPPVASPTTPVATTPDIAITAFLGGVRLELIELYNQSDRALFLGKLAIRLTDNSGDTQQIQYADTEGYILPGRYVSYAADNDGFRRLPHLPRGFQRDIVQIELIYDGIVIQTVNNIPENQAATIAVHKQRSKKIKQTGSFEKDFQLNPAAVQFYDDGHYLPPADTAGLVITEVLTNPRQCLVDDDQLDDCADFIEVMNQGAEPIDLGKYRLRFGLYGDTASVASTFHWGRNSELNEEIILQPQEVLVVKKRDDGKALSLAADDRSVWLEDIQGLARYQTVAVKGADREARRGSSWALFHDGWGWATPTPGKWTNVRAIETAQSPRSQSPPREDLAPCQAGYYRHPETKRCRKIEVAKTPAPCKEGYYRSEQTGRCWSIVALAAKTLKPCQDGYFRNPETGRCKKIAADSDVLKECAEGYERNPATNRCRKIKTTTPPTADFAPESVKQVAGATWGWWVFGGVSLLAVGYGTWQWRWELSQLIRRLRR